MATPEIDVNYVADLARLELSPEEAERLSGQLADILGYVAKLSDLDVTGVEPMAHAAPVYDVMREDVSRPGAGTETALANAPDKSGDQFKVTRVVE
jgi:aspartyl-tRNA(Asn)/glutamyl-tRNA(Gln) amidotransferase subunit C